MTSGFDVWPPCEICGSDGFPADFSHTVWQTKHIGIRGDVNIGDVVEGMAEWVRLGPYRCMDCEADARLTIGDLEGAMRLILDEWVGDLPNKNTSTREKILLWRRTLGCYNYRGVTS